MAAGERLQGAVACSLVACSACGHENREGARFCGVCGSSLAQELTCAACGAANPPENRFCEECGTALGTPAPAPEASTLPDHLAEKIRAGGPALEGERKHVTVLFADVMGSMDLSEQVDAEQWRAIMERFFAILSEGVHRFEGTVDKFTGDGIMALFGAPIAHEDHALRAGYAALHLHRTLADYAAELRRDRGLSFSTRIGLNSGEVIVGEIGDDLKLEYTAIGHTVGLAQRMEALAEPGSTYLTQATAQLMTGYLVTEDLGEFAVKGASEPVHVHRLTGTGSARSRLDLSAQRGFSRFVGRAEELATLEGALKRALEGNPLVIGVVGEAGVGKSRLCHELAERVRAQGIPVYHAAASSHGRTLPFSAALDLVRTYFGVDERTDEQSVREKVAGRLVLLDPEFQADLPLLFEFLGVADPGQPAPHMDPEARQRRLMALIGRLVHAQSHREPGVTVIEDLHWLDPGSELMLEALIDALPGTRTLVVANFRPEYQSDWMRRPHYQQLPVVPLGAEAAQALLRELLGEHPSLDGLAEEIRRRTGGNPFFIEEVVLGLAEEGTLSGERGAFALAHSVDHVTVPPTVQTVLAARIDRLGARDKSLLQAAAVLGREFGEPVLQRIAELSEHDLAAGLRALTASDFLYQQALYPEPEYAFRHPLTHEVAYGSQLTERRARLHGAVAHAIEQLYADALDERAALLAEHWDAAGETRLAARWSARAAMWAGVTAPAEALRWWRVVRDRTADLPEDPETLGLGVVARAWILQLGWRVGIPESEMDESYDTGVALAERADDLGSQALIRIAYGATMGLRGRVKDSLPIQREAAALARQTGSRALVMGVAAYLIYFEFLGGDLAAAEHVAVELIELADDDAMLGSGIAVRCPLGWVHMMRTQPLLALGRLREADESWRTGLALSTEHDDFESQGWCWLSGVNAAWGLGTLDMTLDYGARALHLAEQTGSPFSRYWAMCAFGRAHSYTGDPVVGAEYIERALALARETGTGLEGEAFNTGILADAYLTAGDLERALLTARRAVAVAYEQELPRPAHFAEEILARVLVAGRRFDEAAQVLDKLTAGGRGRGGALFEALAAQVRCSLLVGRGDLDAAPAAFAEARRMLEAMGATGRLAALDALESERV